MSLRATSSSRHASQVASTGVDAPTASAKDRRGARMDRSVREMLVRVTRNIVLQTRQTGTSSCSGM